MRFHLFHQFHQHCLDSPLFHYSLSHLYFLVIRFHLYRLRCRLLRVSHHHQGYHLLMQELQLHLHHQRRNFLRFLERLDFQLLLDCLDFHYYQLHPHYLLDLDCPLFQLHL
jgi:hypothetical protein